MTFNIKPGKQIISVFLGRDFLPTTLERYNVILNRVIKNIRNVPHNISVELANIHEETTRRVLRDNRLSPEARSALVSHLETSQRNVDEIKIVSMSEVSAFFEFGVREHMVFPNMVSITGNPVSEWLESRGLPQAAFIVGKPGTSLDKRNPLKFMEKGFDRSFQQAPQVTSEIIKNI